MSIGTLLLGALGVLCLLAAQGRVEWPRGQLVRSRTRAKNEAHDV